MGWFGEDSWKTAQDVKQHLVREYSREGLRVLAHGGSGSEFYMAIERDGMKSGVLLCLIERYDGAYSYKPIHESMGPYYYGCPEKVIRAAGEPPNESAREWRRKVGEEKERAKRSFVAGEGVRAYGRDYVIVNPIHSRTHATIRATDGTLYRAKKKDIERAQ